MRLAIEQARCASAAGEVPVGAVIVKNGQVVATGRNAPIASHDPSAHAEMIALRGAGQALGNYRMDGCTLYVTLEPCAMCSGAMLHARLDRVVYGAPDAKTGAAGSVLNLFAHDAINHRTQITGGVLAAECADLLKAFFKPKRTNAQPVRQDALRTPAGCFDKLPDYPWEAHYLSHLPSLNGLRMHYLDEGADPHQQGSQVTYVMLHDAGSWSYQFRHMVPVFLAAGGRVLVPDLVGFGKSDKPKKASAHTFNWHRRVLLEWIADLDLQQVVLVTTGWGGTLGLTLPPHEPSRYDGLLAINPCLPRRAQSLPPTWQKQIAHCRHIKQWTPACLPEHVWQALRPDEVAAFRAPFPDAGHCAGLHALPALLDPADDESCDELFESTESFWRNAWGGRALLVENPFGSDMSKAMLERLQLVAGREKTELIRSASPIDAQWCEQLAHRWLNGAPSPDAER